MAKLYNAEFELKLVEGLVKYNRDNGRKNFNISHGGLSFQIKEDELKTILIEAGLEADVRDILRANRIGNADVLNFGRTDKYFFRWLPEEAKKLIENTHAMQDPSLSIVRERFYKWYESLRNAKF